MSDTRNDAHDSIDTSPLTLEQLSDDELTNILSIEHQLKVRQAPDRASAANKKPYLAPVQVRHPQVLLLDGARGTGKTSLLLTMAHRWNIHDDCDVKRHDHDKAQYEARVTGLADRLHFEPSYAIPTHIHPLRILDFDPLPPQMPLVAGIIQAWQPLAKEYDALFGRSQEECYGGLGTLDDQWNNLFRVAAVGWSPVPPAKGLLEHVLDRQEQISDWQRLGQSWQEFVTIAIACGKRLRDHDQLGDDPIFVIMIDDVDLQVGRIRELLPALRMLYHPNVAFLVAADWTHLVDTLKVDFLGQQNRLGNARTNRNVLSSADEDQWSGILARAAATKVFPLKNKWTLRKLTLQEVLKFPDSGANGAEPEESAANTQPTMGAILNKWTRKEAPMRLGDYLRKMAGTRDDPYEMPPFITYRDAHQILGRASMQPEGEARAIEAIRCLISGPASEAVALGKAEEGEPIIEYRGVGQLAALFRPGQVEETSASSGIVLGARPDFFYREKPSSEAIFMQGYGGTSVNFTSVMLAVTMQDALYGVTAPGLQWNIRLALVWTNAEVFDGNSLRKLAFQWRFHKHPHPFELLGLSHKWREFVRGFQANPEQRLERIAYAWIYYQLESRECKMNSAPLPLDIEHLSGDHWELLLEMNPPKAKGQDWRTRTLPLLARPELGLPPDVQLRLLRFVSSDADAQDRSREHEWLRAQRRRLITDAIIAAAEEERRRAEDAENEERVSHIVWEFEQQHRETYGEPSPWWTTIQDPADDSP